MIKNFDIYKLVDFIRNLNINYSDFNLSSDQFDCKSDTHGINHTYRVMFNCILIGYRINNILDTKRAFMAAYIHDMARKHDYHCMVHGVEASEKKLPMYKDLLIKNGMIEEDIEAIKLAIYNHSHREEVNKLNPYYKTIAILRDADGLDLCRIDIEIRPDILRFRESIELIGLAEELFIETDFTKYDSFTQYMTDAIKVVENELEF